MIWTRVTFIHQPIMLTPNTKRVPVRNMSAEGMVLSFVYQVLILRPSAVLQMGNGMYFFEKLIHTNTKHTLA